MQSIVPTAAVDRPRVFFWLSHFGEHAHYEARDEREIPKNSAPAYVKTRTGLPSRKAWIASTVPAK